MLMMLVLERQRMKYLEANHHPQELHHLYSLVARLSLCSAVTTETNRQSFHAKLARLSIQMGNHFGK